MWYFDGSLFDGRWKPFRATGFGIVVTTVDGHLIGFGRGTPPSWCRTAAAAEAWALHVVLSLCPFAPAVRTDCLSLLRVAEEGSARAMAPNKQLARIWCMITGALDGDVASLMRDGQLVWMPAHQTLSSVGEKKLPSGARLTFVDWRANRLVDALAKRSSAEVRTSVAVRSLLDSAWVAVRHFAALLGRVTHAANNHTAEVMGEDGIMVVRRMRDATVAPRSYTKKVGGTCQPRTPAHAVLLAPAASGFLAAPPCRKRARPVSSHGTRERAEGIANTRRRVEEIGAALATVAAGPSAAERLRALHLRVIARTAA